jgi:PEP-CTERM motif
LSTARRIVWRVTSTFIEVTMNITKHFAAAALAAAATLGSAQAATVSLFGTRADFLTGIGAVPTLTQDFEGYAVGTNLVGVNVLPGISLSTNLESLNVFNSVGIGKIAFATSRNQPEAVYNINFTGNTKAFGFDIAAFDPGTPGPGFLSFFFADGDTTYTLIPVLPLNATEQDPLFFGVISNSALTRITWSEGPETNGFSCCEETGLDNFITLSPIPEPSSWALMIAGLGSLGWYVRRRNALLK